MAPSLRLRSIYGALCIVALAVASLAPAVRAQSPTVERVPLPAPERLRAVEAYIDTTWVHLTRSHDDLLAAVPDPKVDHTPDTPWPLYIAADADSTAIAAELQAAMD